MKSNQREIKFRAINAKGEIIYGLPYTDGVNETSYFKEYNNRLCWRNEKGQHCNQPYKNGTLMQYTGLLDKNGIEIYEGDVVSINNPKELFQVIFRDGSFYPSSELLQKCDDSFNLVFYEVVGNIYENQELIGEAE